MSPTILALFVAVPSLFASHNRIIIVFMICCLFGAAAAIEITALGNAPITPAVFCLPFLSWWAIKQNGVKAIVNELRYPSAGAWLLYLSIWGVFSAFALPRYFAGDTYVFITSRSVVSSGPALVLLGPNSTNITQACYLLGTLVAFVALRSLLRKDEGLQVFRNAVIALTCANTVAALLGLIEEYLGVPLGMDFVRNASYANFGTVEVVGLVRIVGTFPEASSFASFTCPLFAFMATLWRVDYMRWTTGPLALISFLLLALSTSSTAYGALSIYLFIIILFWLKGILMPKQIFKLGATYCVLWTAMVGVCLLILLKPQVFDQARAFLEVTVWQKLESNSGVERGTWNRQAWTAFLDSFGVGVGLGSARASNNIIVTLSNVGIIGAFLYTAFLTAVFRGAQTRFDGEQQPVAQASAHAVFMILIAGLFGQTNFDAGPALAAFAAAAATGATVLNKPTAVSLEQRRSAARSKRVLRMNR